MVEGSLPLKEDPTTAFGGPPPLESEGRIRGTA
jgi:hypothetical protein